MLLWGLQNLETPFKKGKIKETEFIPASCLILALKWWLILND
ncbi:hypothetical protein LWHH1689_0829 [Limosilactobacillus reuteri]|uniref:Uncharacterized protein n=1 Tax=Limosilactobacillus reuteri TaxID=1598 RepID=A0A2S1EQA1_LIMRT|nr:hypothetical protein LWHH1689_0829 [Limosilactobacillus reuteri]